LISAGVVVAGSVVTTSLLFCCSHVTGVPAAARLLGGGPAAAAAPSRIAINNICIADLGIRCAAVLICRSSKNTLQLGICCPGEGLGSFARPTIDAYVAQPQMIDILRCSQQAGLLGEKFPRARPQTNII
jgi:hypothetical protein